MTWFDAKRLIAIILLFFGMVSLLNVFVPYLIVPNTVILGVLLLMFGRQMYQEAMLDQIEPSGEKKE
jgi:xanthine/uracil permease